MIWASGAGSGGDRTQRGTLMALIQPSRVLAVRLSAIGDVVRTLPSVLALRRTLPKSHLAWLVEDIAADALAGHPEIDALWVIPRRKWRRGLRSPRTAPATLREMAGFVRRLRGEAFDWVVDFHGILKSGLWTRVTGAPLRIGYEPAGNRGWGSREGNRFFMTHRVDVPPERISRFQRNEILVRYVREEILGLEADTFPDGIAGPILPVGASAQADVNRFLDSAPHAAPGRESENGSGALIAIHPGSSESTAYKRWHPERYGEVADALLERGHRVIFTWGPGEREAVEAIASAMKRRPIIAPETPTLQHVAALFRQCALYIGNDTGPMHIAALSGTPVLAVFGPTDPTENAPYPGVPSVVVRKDVGCDCPKRRCLTRACFDAVASEDVLHAALGLLRP